MQIILVTHAGRRTRSLHVRKWQLVVVLCTAMFLTFGGSLYAWVGGGPNLTLLQKVVEIWEGTRHDALAGKIGELSARIESLEAVMDARPQANAMSGGLQRQSLGRQVPEDVRRYAILQLETRAGLLEAELERQLARREDTVRSMLDRPLDKPVAGVMTSTFGWRKDPMVGEPAFHNGIDFSAPAGTPVRTAAAGVVSFIGPADSYGKLVVVSHGGRVQSRYAHLEGIEVTTGMPVVPGQRIGRVGSTGRSTGPHLHFELVLDGRVVNPRPFLEGSMRVATSNARAS